MRVSWCGRMYRLTGFILLSAALGSACGAVAQAGKAAVPMSEYRDPNGVSFEYPTVWTRKVSDVSYFGTTILKNDLPSRVVVVFSPAGNLYAKTTLAGLSFTYAVLPSTTLSACDAQAGTDSPDAKVDEIQIHGVAFKHATSSDAGMCHGIERNLYWTYRDGSCHLFEAEFQTICYGAVDGQRHLTDAETRALHRHLLAIPQSIRFGLAR